MQGGERSVQVHLNPQPKADPAGTFLFYFSSGITSGGTGNHQSSYFCCLHYGFKVISAPCYHKIYFIQSRNWPQYPKLVLVGQYDPQACLHVITAVVNILETGRRVDSVEFEIRCYCLTFSFAVFSSVPHMPRALSFLFYSHLC